MELEDREMERAERPPIISMIIKRIIGKRTIIIYSRLDNIIKLIVIMMMKMMMKNVKRKQAREANSQ